MKLKLLPVIIASMTLVACGTNEPSSSPTSAPASTSMPVTWEFLDFLSGENNLRIDIFDFEDGLQVSYGNAALVEGVNSLKLSDSAKLSINKNLTHEKSFNTLLVAEKQNQGTSFAKKEVTLGTEGDHLTDLFDLIKGDLVGFERAYIAFSIGETAKWTKGLNSKVDEYFEAAIKPNAED